AIKWDGISTPMRARSLNRVRRRGWPKSIELAAGHVGHLAHDPVGGLAGRRQLALALEFLDRGFGLGVDDPARLDLPVTEIGKRSLERHHPLRGRLPLGGGVVADRQRRARRSPIAS